MIQWEVIRESEKLKSEISAVSQQILQPFYEKFRTNALQLAILNEAESNPNLTLNSLAATLNRAATNLSVKVTAMVKDDLLKKVVANHDRRIIYIQPTAKGLDLIRKSRSFIIKRYEMVDEDDTDIQNLVAASTIYLDKLLEAKRKPVTQELFDSL
ncbi:MULTISPECIES: MarR family winged helix-turn-helix transcriptional regulator [unclassified Breznakia]|uniref:MarR family winged helix-turn-helix transcriptional regulator n=1 Tax=unclassified Breznakia TaxID=2623764 RepID=UPI0024759EE5|nr:MULTISPECIES: MarR family winged helix-turn-helix transcriptional regulator [unclassified Breznakia]MDH6368074.1 DNA-binding MarR family transcriptional regulator [Breznakia sp. PH1-1]MDH6405165.1 DNA-binding MarR family transcriptional regulator [Breznakia sp. PF1-11]MDH6412877.1 DNA-binding MarR family transcriptional regulator [Breznakia sp. PFB1-11]MDH6415241.1 DNA-binding MarR family transcriptional regulator [Breznakia sp. PFB1-14]MDH6417551.1 DNA-binding MarR family transcriptional r